MIPGVGADIALYFFLAGTGAGMYVVAWALRMLGRFPLERESPGPATLATTFAPPVLVALGSLFLFASLGVPSQALLVLCRPFQSTISFGAWSLLLFLACFAADELTLRLRIPMPRAARGIVGGLTLLSACSVIVYTGVYLFRTASVAFWHSPFIVMLFTASSLTCGTAMALLVLFFTMPRSRSPLWTLSRLCGALATCEAALMALFLASRLLAGGKAAAFAWELLIGEHAPMFWLLVVAFGMVGPAVCTFLASRNAGPAFLAAASVGTLVGGLALRCSIILL